VIQDNSVRASMGIGIHVTGDSVVSGNLVETTQAADPNPGIGIHAPISAVTVVGNTVSSNAGLGLVLSPFAGFSNNTITGNNGLLGNPPQTSGGIPLGTNLCGNDTICP
jgi:hypothetical protein